MRHPSSRSFDIFGAILLAAAIITSSLHGAWQYRALSQGEGLSAPLLGGFVLILGGLILLLRKRVGQTDSEMDAVIETIERIGRGEHSCSLPMEGKGDTNRLCEAINQMALDLQTTTTPKERLRQEIDDRRAVETALADSQRLWEKTFNAVPDLITILDNKHRILKMNAAMEATVSCSGTTCQGKKCFTQMHGSDAPHQQCPLDRMLTTGEEHISEFFEPKLKRWLEVRVSPLRDADGAIAGAVHVARDIHAHKELEAELEKRNIELQKSVAALEDANERILEQQKQLIKEERLKALLQMAGATAHEMNQPLMALQGNIELLQHEGSTPERRAIHIERIYEAGGRLAAIVRKIQTLHHDEVRPYPGGLAIVDLHKEDAADPKDQKFG
jgi:PAS domain S-box-containing protein